MTFLSAGLVYVIDRERFNCTIVPMDNVAIFDVKVLDDGHHVRMKTVREFFGFDNSGSKMNWTYVGTVNIGQRTLLQFKVSI